MIIFFHPFTNNLYYNIPHYSFHHNTSRNVYRQHSSHFVPLLHGVRALVFLLVQIHTIHYINIFQHPKLKFSDVILFILECIDVDEKITYPKSEVKKGFKFYKWENLNNYSIWENIQNEKRWWHGGFYERKMDGGSELLRWREVRDTWLMVRIFDGSVSK